MSGLCDPTKSKLSSIKQVSSSSMDHLQFTGQPPSPSILKSPSLRNATCGTMSIVHHHQQQQDQNLQLQQENIFMFNEVETMSSSPPSPSNLSSPFTEHSPSSGSTSDAEQRKHLDDLFETALSTAKTSTTSISQGKDVHQKVQHGSSLKSRNLPESFFSVGSSHRQHHHDASPRYVVYPNISFVRNLTFFCYIFFLRIFLILAACIDDF